METLFQDARHGFRMLLKNPGFTLVAVITLAIGIGANTLIFSIVDSVLLRPLLFKDSSRLVMLWQTTSQRSEQQEKNPQVAGPPDLNDWNTQNQVFEGMAAYFNWTYNRMGFKFVIEGRAATKSGEEPDAAYRAITPEYFRAMSIPLLQGREFSRQDERTSTPVVIINQSMARQFWRGEDPTGKRIRFGDRDAPWYSIVGIAGDVKHMGLDANEGAAIYQPYAQKQFSFLRWMTLVMRTDVQPASLIAAVRSQVHALDNDQPVYDVATLDQLLSNSIARPRFYTALLGSFAVVALILASLGTYGVMSFSVSQRRREIGIRLAMGVGRGDIFKLVVGRGLLLALTGVAIGLGGALALTRLMSGLLFGVSATDPVTFIIISLLLAGVALAACYVPARRATKVDPMVALRYE